MLLSAFAATVVIVSWVLTGVPIATPPAPPSRDTQLAEQPLIGLGAG